MNQADTSNKSIPLQVVDKQVAGDKIARNRAGFDADAPVLRKPSWIRVRLPQGNAVQHLKSKLREQSLVTVCEEASCPNIHECFSKGTATFMILGEVCTRRCSFCDVAHGRPAPPDAAEPARLAETIATWACATWSSPRSTATTCATAARRTSPRASAPCATPAPTSASRS